MSWRLMIDYQWLNANMGRLIPNIARVSATLQAATHEWMAVLDVKDVFFMVPFQDAGEVIFLDFLQSKTTVCINEQKPDLGEWLGSHKRLYKC